MRPARRQRYFDSEPALVRLARIAPSLEPPDDPGRAAGPWHLVSEWARESDTCKLLVTSCGLRYLDDRAGDGDVLDVKRVPVRLWDLVTSGPLVCTECEL